METRQLPEVQHSFEPLKRMLYGAVQSRLLLASVELDVFSHLRQPRSARDLADAIGTHPDNTRVFLDALTANDLLRKRGGRYRNTPLADAFLVRGEPTYLGRLLENFAGYMASGLEELGALVREGPPPCASHGPDSPAALAEETELYANYQRAGRAQQAAALARALPEFAGARRMLDLGCGAGLMGIAIVAAHPELTGVLFDRPEVIEVARRHVVEHGLEERVTVVGGDYNEDPIGEGYDLVWSSYTLLPSALEPVIGKVHRAMNPGGIYLNLSEGLTDEGTRPTMMVNSMLSIFLRHGGAMIEEGQVAAAMLGAGFRSVHSRQVAGPQLHGPGLLDVARR
jgi:ubiquinone/menaquinone biosynthesis C-methylase UbiE